MHDQKSRSHLVTGNQGITSAQLAITVKEEPADDRTESNVRIRVVPAVATGAPSAEAAERRSVVAPAISVEVKKEEVDSERQPAIVTTSKNTFISPGTSAVTPKEEEPEGLLERPIKPEVVTDIAPNAGMAISNTSTATPRPPAPGGRNILILANGRRILLPPSLMNALPSQSNNNVAGHGTTTMLRAETTVALGSVRPIRVSGSRLAVRPPVGPALAGISISEARGVPTGPTLQHSGISSYVRPRPAVPVATSSLVRPLRSGIGENMPRHPAFRNGTLAITTATDTRGPYRAASVKQVIRPPTKVVSSCALDSWELDLPPLLEPMVPQVYEPPQNNTGVRTSAPRPQLSKPSQISTSVRPSAPRPPVPTPHNNTGVRMSAPRPMRRPERLVYATTSTASTTTAVDQSCRPKPTLESTSNCTNSVRIPAPRPLRKSLVDATTSSFNWESCRPTLDFINNVDDSECPAGTSFQRHFPVPCGNRCEVISAARLRYDPPKVFYLYTGVSLGAFEVLAKDVQDSWMSLKAIPTGETEDDTRERSVAESKQWRRPDTHEDELLMTMIKLKTNFPASVVGYLFGYQAEVVIDVLQSWIPFLASWLKPFITWPSNNAAFMEGTPKILRKKYGAVPFAVLDVVDVKLAIDVTTEDVIAKFVVVYNWQGAIVYRSRLFDGVKTSDQAAIKACSEILGLWKHSSGRRYPMYVVNRHSCVASKYCVEMETSKNRVQRITSKLRQFAILSDRAFPSGLIPCVDEVVTICCALVNLSSPLDR